MAVSFLQRLFGSLFFTWRGGGGGAALVFHRRCFSRGVLPGEGRGGGRARVPFYSI